MGENVQGVRVENRRPSDVFLALWRYHVLNERSGSKLEDFAQLADVWQQIREMEAMTAGEQRRQEVRRVMDFWPYQPAGMRAEQAPPLQTGHADADTIPDREQAPAPEAVSESDHALQEDPGDPLPEARDDKKEDSAGKKAIAERKQKAMARLETYRNEGVSLQEIADAARGLTITDIMNILDRKPLPVAIWAKIEKALDALDKLKQEAAG